MTYDVSLSSSICSLPSNFFLSPPPPPRHLLPAYSSPPPPAYSPRPARTLTVSRSAYESLLSNRGPRTLNEAFALSLEDELARQERESAIRAKLERLLFPQPRGVGEVLGSLFGWKNKSSRRPVSLGDLDEEERTVARRMQDEFVERCNAMGY